MKLSKTMEFPYMIYRLRWRIFRIIGDYRKLEKETLDVFSSTTKLLNRPVFRNNKYDSPCYFLAVHAAMNLWHIGIVEKKSADYKVKYQAIIKELKADNCDMFSIRISGLLQGKALGSFE